VADIHIGTAGWSIPRQYADRFPAEGPSLERYSARLTAAEINSSFHRPHRPATWERWRDSVPGGFRFSVKLPKEITHQRKLVDIAEPLDDFATQVRLLGDKLAVLLVQLPPKLEFDPAVAAAFFTALARHSPAPVACEPRHPSWFEDRADALLARLSVARVAADPAIRPEAAVPGGWTGLAYWRLHGSPAMYRSAYGDRVRGYADALKGAAAAGREAWCIFDNTASSAAMGDALALLDELRR
jgi:uncharacterized protein YecE (DUF72 family)